MNEWQKSEKAKNAVIVGFWVVSIYGLRPPITADQNVIQIDIKF